ncbi:hypothetical protein [Streptomyces sp. NPDC058240]|uniref:hypothetical protein n=1 Tax=Streptomyces sp. NPDC058240 TaxID=3346396 RepID=UPI0036E9B22D
MNRHENHSAEAEARRTVPAEEASGHRSRGRLVGVVRRNAPLQALIRDDAEIRAEVVARIESCCPPGDRESVAAAVHDGIVESTGNMPPADAARPVAEVGGIADVVEVKNLLTAGT